MQNTCTSHCRCYTQPARGSAQRAEGILRAEGKDLPPLPAWSKSTLACLQRLQRPAEAAGQAGTPGRHGQRSAGRSPSGAPSGCRKAGASPSGEREPREPRSSGRTFCCEARLQMGAGRRRCPCPPLQAVQQSAGGRREAAAQRQQLPPTTLRRHAGARSACWNTPPGTRDARGLVAIRALCRTGEHNGPVLACL